MVLFGLLLGFALLSLLWTVNRYSTALWVVQWAITGGVFWLAYVLAGEPKGREWMVRAYLLTASVFSVAAIGMYILSDYERLTGTFYWANPAAGYLLPAILLAADRLRQHRGRRAYAWAGVAALFLVAFLLADSRSATLVLIISLVLYLLLVRTNKRYWITLVFVALASYGLSFGVSWAATNIAQKDTSAVPGARFAEAARGESNSVTDRVYFWRSAAEIWLAKPVGGSGAGTYGDLHPRFQSRVISASDNAHNFYVQLLPELGIIGVLLVAALLVTLGVGAVRGVVAAPESMVLLIAAGALVLHFGLDIDAKYPAMTGVLAVLLGLIFRQFSDARRAPTWRMPVAALIVAAPVVGWYLSDVWEQRGRVAQEDLDYETAAVMFEQAQVGPLYDPDLINAEGIAWYTLATAGGPNGFANSTLALQQARLGARLDPADGQHKRLEGRVLALRGDLKGAEAALREALRLDPYNHPEYAADLAGVQVQRGDTEGAIRSATAMLDQYPMDVVANRNADETVRGALASLAALVGNVYLDRGDLPAARVAAQRALEYDAESVKGRGLKRQVDLRSQ
jgi:O-antigen ligase